MPRHHTFSPIPQQGSRGVDRPLPSALGLCVALLGLSGCLELEPDVTCPGDAAACKPAGDASKPPLNEPTSQTSSCPADRRLTDGGCSDGGTQCKGDEVLVDGVCQPTDDDAECNDVSDCPAYSFCEGEAYCDQASKQCGQRTAPTSETACTTESNVAGECLDRQCVPLTCGDGQTDTGEECDDGRDGDDEDGCRDDCTFTCTGDSDCDNGDACDGAETCNLESHLCFPGQPLQCAAADCQSTSCDPTQGCMQTDVADGTACGSETNQLCLAGVCETSTCGDGYIDEAAGEQCEDGNGAAGDGCEPNTCRFTCETHIQCPGGRCDANHVCVECITDDHCTTAAKPVCEANVCSGCQQGSDCNRFAPRGLCDTDGVCVECMGDGDCSGEQCLQRACGCASQDHTGCYQGDVYDYDSCGNREGLREDCCNGCSGGACSPVDPQAGYVCYQGNSYYEDSCGQRGALHEPCCDGCSNGTCNAPQPQAYQACYDDDVYWYDSCGNRGSKATECGEALCDAAACNGSCPSDMVPVPGTSACMDRYEGSVFANANCTGTQYGISGPNYPAGFPETVESANLKGTVTLGGAEYTTAPQTTAVYACSRAGVYPARSISFFRAQRACENVGKRVCDISELRAACTDTYNYGPTFDPDACNGKEHGVGDTVPTGSMSGCEGSVPGLFDLLYNLGPWGGCDATRCYMFGGAYVSDDSYTCTSYHFNYATNNSLTTGFRCCMDR